MHTHELMILLEQRIKQQMQRYLAQCNDRNDATLILRKWRNAQNALREIERVFDNNTPD